MLGMAYLKAKNVYLIPKLFSKFIIGLVSTYGILDSCSSSASLSLEIYPLNKYDCHDVLVKSI